MCRVIEGGMDAFLSLNDFFIDMSVFIKQ